ncbi:unnamed protein product [Bursaphelenchus okinawaensis]|uniref:STAS domain-containing protein n=1 Tax=Bursaphelenchus okinawaensis TaxID=465554 RepID=A0A811L346_9BILA|nr:unnamed protein product [Bursaphelenchus okinawaensis]CAG9116584.1 unnamed protein product [Bursaphelenchus okinawaensis]
MRSGKEKATKEESNVTPDVTQKSVTTPKDGSIREFTPPSRSRRRYRSLSSIQTMEPTTMPSLPMQKMTKVINLEDLMTKPKFQDEYTAKSRTPEQITVGQDPVKKIGDDKKRLIPAVMNLEEFDKRYGFRRVDLSLSSRIYNCLAEAKRWSFLQWLWFIKCFFPITQWLVDYDWKHDFLMDCISGVMMAVMCIPQGLAYGFLVGLKPTHGLYTCIVGPLVYAVLGTSKHASPGAFAIIALMVGSVVEQTTGGTKNDFDLNATALCCQVEKTSQSSPTEVINIVAGLTICVGLLQIAFGILNMGLLAVWMSDHLVQGLTSGAAIHVLTSQIKSMTGVEGVPKTSDISGMAKFYICFFRNISTIKTGTTLTSLGICSILIFSKEVLDPIFIKWLKVKFPMEFFVVFFSVLICYFSDGTIYEININIVGYVEPGMMAPFLPDLQYAARVVHSAIAIAVVSFVIHVALAKLISKKMNYTVDANQEWFALGMMNMIASFFGCFAGGSSLSRTMTSMKLGTRSQMSTIVCAIVLIMTVYFATQYLYYLPQPVLACIVVVALKDLFVQVADSAKLIKKSMFDFLIWFVTFVGVILLNVNWGLLVGVSFALLTVVFRSQWAESTCMGRIPDTSDFKGLEHYREAKEDEGIRIYRFDAPLYFANAELFLRRLHAALDDSPTVEPPIELNVRTRYANSKEITSISDQKETRPSEKDQKEPATEDDFVHLSHFIIDCSSFPYIDLMGLEVLEQAYTDLSNMGIRVFFCNCKVAVRQFFEQNDFYKRVPKANMYCSIIPAVLQATIERENDKDKQKKIN